MLDGQRVLFRGKVQHTADSFALTMPRVSTVDFQVCNTARPIPPGLVWLRVVVEPETAHVQPLARSLLGDAQRSPKLIFSSGAQGPQLVLAASVSGTPGPDHDTAQDKESAISIWLASVEQHHTWRVSRKRRRPSPDCAACDQGDAGAEPVLRDAPQRDDAPPAVAVLRDAALTAACMIVANQLVRHRPYSAQTKTGRSMRKESTLTGVQGIVGRWIFGSFLKPQRMDCFSTDPLLPQCPPGGHSPDKGVVKEFERLGLPPDAAGSTEKLLALSLHAAAKLVSNFALSVKLSDAWTDTEAGLQAIGPSGIPLENPGPAQLKAAASSTIKASGDVEGCVRLVWTAPATHFQVPCEGLPLHVAKPFDLASSVSVTDGPGHARWTGGPPYPPSARDQPFTFPSTVTLELRESHYAKLLILYARASLRGGSPSDSQLAIAGRRLHTRMFNCLARYETLSGNSSGFQGAVTHVVFDTLSDAMGASVEGFASPLNCYLPQFCSLFPDVDCHFGSLGDFFGCSLREGCYEVNPPFVHATLGAAWDKMRTALEASELVEHSAGALSTVEAPALQFIFITPGWADAGWAQEAAASPFCSARLQPGLGAHEYRDGVQWRSRRLVWSANTQSYYFFLQNTAARQKYPLSTQLLHVLESRLQESVVDQSVPLLQEVGLPRSNMTPA